MPARSAANIRSVAEHLAFSLRRRHCVFVASLSPQGFSHRTATPASTALGDQLNMKSAGSRHDDAVEAPGTQHGAKIGMNRNFWSG
jgi:hypothetical protein